jgi:hypothetical protein
MNNTYTAQTSNRGSKGTSGSVSAVPERFRSVTDAQPGRSAVPDRFRSVTRPTPGRAKDAETGYERRV